MDGNIRVINIGGIFKKFLLAVMLVLLVCTSALAIGVWSEGKVTEKAWFEQYARIEINEVVYTCMPEIKVWLPGRVTANADGKKQAELLQEFQPGRKVRIKANGHMIYEIMAEEQR